MIEVEGLSKRYGDKVAVRELSFTVTPGRVTGFLGPNGAGKSTTMRAIVGLERPSAGRARVNGRDYAELPAPLTQVGALLEARSTHPGRSALAHLQFLARANGLGRRRVAEVLDLVGLGEVARQRAGKFSLGMGQRLGIAAALLGDPPTLLFDEPVNGLDPEGIIWARQLMRSLAAEGRTVLVSSHLMAEMALTADHLVVIGRGRLIAATTVGEVLASASSGEVLVRTPVAARLRPLLLGAAEGVTVADADEQGSGAIVVGGLPAQRIGEVAAQHGVVLHELTPRTASLEEAFMTLTADEVEYLGADLHEDEHSRRPRRREQTGVGA